MIRDHALCELFDVGVLCLQFGKLGGLYIDLVGGDDDGGDLGVGGPLG
jgi:hypothetical protein